MGLSLNPACSSADVCTLSRHVQVLYNGVQKAYRRGQSWR